ncbi:hypothetical protein HDU76_004981 [Blyttiomyces sp. JEL0837]|nr:hypothetical protein HDU76_004981 [Blyttiomyces sp. JEL0837]
MSRSTLAQPPRGPQRRIINLWDNTPAEIKLQIYDHCDALTLFLNNLMTEDQIESTYGTKIWEAAFAMDWTGDLSILPQDQFPTTHQSLVLVHSRRLYNKLCEMKPSLTTTFYTSSTDADQSRSWLNGISKKPRKWGWDVGELENMEAQLIHIPMRHFWTEDLFQLTYLSTDQQIRLLAISGHFGHLQLVQSLVKVLPHDRHLVTALEFALHGSCFYGYEDMIRYILSIEPDMDCSHGITRAIRNGNVDIVRLLMNGKYEYQLDNRDIHDILYGEIKTGQTDAVKLVLKFKEILGMDISAFDNEAIRHACGREGDNLDIVKLLLANHHGIDINDAISYEFNLVDHVRERNFEITFKSEYSAIGNAAAFGNINILKHLLQVYQLDPKTTLVNNYLILEAAGRGHYEMTQYLLTNTNVDPTFEDSITLVVAVRYSKVVKVLLEDGRVNPACRQKKAFIQAAGYWVNVDVVRMLLDTGNLDLTVQDFKDVWELLRYRYSKSNNELVKLLWERYPKLVEESAGGFSGVSELLEELKV